MGAGDGGDCLEKESVKPSLLSTSWQNGSERGSESGGRGFDPGLGERNFIWTMSKTHLVQGMITYHHQYMILYILPQS